MQHYLKDKRAVSIYMNITYKINMKKINKTIFFFNWQRPVTKVYKWLKSYEKNNLSIGDIHTSHLSRVSRNLPYSTNSHMPRCSI